MIVSSDASFPPDEDDSLDIELRSLDAAYRRAVLLATLVRRAAVEEPIPEAGEQDPFERETDRFELYSWASKELGETATDSEQTLLRAPIGGLTQEDIDVCLASALPANALMWALGGKDSLDLGDNPKAIVEALLGWASRPWDDVGRAAGKHRLRSEELVAFERERWELWHWRATLDESDLDPGETLQGLVADVAEEAAVAGIVDVSERDFAVDGRPFGSLSEDEQERVTDEAEGYLVALNWLCGFGSSWDDVPLYPE